jgi:hypothetical protein
MSVFDKEDTGHNLPTLVSQRAPYDATESFEPNLRYLFMGLSEGWIPTDGLWLLFGKGVGTM